MIQISVLTIESLYVGDNLHPKRQYSLYLVGPLKRLKKPRPFFKKFIPLYTKFIAPTTLFRADFKYLRKYKLPILS
jgi:hypothetical protein